MLLALDISTSCTGYSVFDNEGKLVEIDFIDLKKFKGLYAKSKEIKSRLTSIINSYSINNIAVEENLQAFRPGLSSAKTILTLAQFNGVVRWICFDTFNIAPVSINVNTARKLVGLKVDKKSGKKTKVQVMEWVDSQEPSIKWPIKEVARGRNKGAIKKVEGCFDMADAYVIGKAFLIENS